MDWLIRSTNISALVIDSYYRSMLPMNQHLYCGEERIKAHDGTVAISEIGTS